MHRIASTIGGLVLIATGAVCLAAELAVRAAGDVLKISAPNFHFLTGKPLARIRDGNAVAFDFQLSVLADNKVSVLRRGFERFVISYDLWEERFSVTRMRTSQASASRLTAEAAELWCVETMSVPLAGLPNDRPVVVRLDVRAQNPKEAPPLLGDGTLSLPTLVEIFSRAGSPQAPNSWRLETSPVQLGSLRSGGRGAD